jgi:hypothetical protein
MEETCSLYAHKYGTLILLLCFQFQYFNEINRIKNVDFTKETMR